MANLYRTSIYLGTDEEGKKRRKYISAHSEDELKEKVIIIKHDLKKNNFQFETAYFDIWADKWLNDYKIPSGIGTGTINQYASAIKHLKNEFGHRELKDIRLDEFQKMINRLAQYNPKTNKPMAKATLSNIVKVMSSILNYAIANRVEGVVNFCKAVNIPKNAPVMKRRALTEQEQEMIINTPHRCQLAAMIMLFSGVRRGELIPLTWSDIDLEKGLITIDKSVDLQTGKAVLKDGGKSESAERFINIPPILIDYLKEYKTINGVKTGLVCPNTYGKLQTKSSFDKMWRSYILDLNIKYGYPDKDVSKFCPCKLPMKIEYFTSHYLRHTFATMLYLQNIDFTTAMQLMGHKNIQVTINTYTEIKNNRFSISDGYKKKLLCEYKIFDK